MLYIYICMRYIIDFINPEFSLKNLISNFTKVLLPDPDLPIIPSFSFGEIDKVKFLITIYCLHIFRNILYFDFTILNNIF